MQRSSPMPTECSAPQLDFGMVEGRRVVAAFDGGAVTSDAGALLLGAADKAIRLVGRFAACFEDGRSPDRVEHEIATMVGRRLFGIALGYEDQVDHDQLRMTRPWRSWPASSKPSDPTARRWPARAC